MQIPFISDVVVTAGLFDTAALAEEALDGASGGDPLRPWWWCGERGLDPPDADDADGGPLLLSVALLLPLPLDTGALLLLDPLLFEL